MTYNDLNQGNDHPVDRDSEHDIGNPVDGDKLQGDDHPVVCDSEPRSASPGKEHPVEKKKGSEKIDHPVEKGVLGAHELHGAEQPSQDDGRGDGLAGGVSDDGPVQPGIDNSTLIVFGKKVEVANVVRGGLGKKTDVRNLIDKYLVKIYMGAARKQKDSPSKPGTSSVGGAELLQG